MFTRLKKIIEKGNYDREEMLLDLADYLDMGGITKKQYDTLIELMGGDTL